jgi:hypothetical protein
VGTTDYRLLADVMEEAAGYFKWLDRRPRLLRVILNFSYRMDLPSAKFPNHDLLMSHARFSSQKRLSEALSDLVSSRALQRDGWGRGGIELTPLPDWWNWAARPADEECADREYVASLVGYVVKRNGSEWRAEAYPAPDVVTQYARAYTRGAFDTAQLIPEEETLNEAVAEEARREAMEAVSGRPEAHASATGEPKRRGRRASQRNTARRGAEASIDVDVAEVVRYAAKLFPEWRGGGALRDAYLAKYAADRGPRLVFRALQAADDFGSKKIFAPISWLKGVVDDMTPQKA